MMDRKEKKLNGDKILLISFCRIHIYFLILGNQLARSQCLESKKIRKYRVQICNRQQLLKCLGRSTEGVSRKLSFRKSSSSFISVSDTNKIVTLLSCYFDSARHTVWTNSKPCYWMQLIAVQSSLGCFTFYFTMPY